MERTSDDSLPSSAHTMSPFVDEERFVHALSQAPLSAFLNVITITGACPPQIVTKLHSPEAMSYFAYHAQSWHSPQGLVLAPVPALVFLCEDSPLHTGGTARTYVGKLGRTASSFKLPEWLSIKGNSCDEIGPFKLYRLQTSLAEYLFGDLCEGPAMRVLIKLPRVEPDIHVQAVAQWKGWHDGCENPSAASWSKARATVNFVHKQHLEEVRQMFSNEQRARLALSPFFHPALTPNITAHWIFHVGFSLTPEAKLYAADNAAVLRLLEAPYYPVVQDHGPSMEWVIAGVREARACLLSGSSTNKKRSKHPDLDDIVCELMKHKSGCAKMIFELETQAEALMDEVAGLGLVHGSIHAGNLCMQLKSNCKGSEANDFGKASNDDSQFEFTWIDFAKSEARDATVCCGWRHCRYSREYDSYTADIHDIFHDLYRALTGMSKIRRPTK